MTDSNIVKLFWQRDERAVELAQSKYGTYCKTIALNILRSSEDAEECVNDSLLRAWASIPPQRPENLRTYLGKLVRNIAINRFEHYSAQKRGGMQTAIVLSELEGCLPADTDVSQSLDAQAVTECINGFLKGQPKQRRIIFVRRYWYLSSIKEIAKDLLMSESKVTSTLFRMRKELKKQLEKEGVNL